MWPFKKEKPEKGNYKINDKLDIDVSDKNVRFNINKEISGEDVKEYIESMAEANNIPVFKGEVKHCYESDFTKQTDQCPRCGTVTERMMSNFAYATQDASRIATTPAGHFCTECPTVIINDDMMRESINPNFKYGGVFSVETGYTKEPRLFDTYNGEKPTYILNETQTNINGVLQSVNLIQDEDFIYIDPKTGSSRKPQSKRTKKRHMNAKKAKRRRRK